MKMFRPEPSFFLPYSWSTLASPLSSSHPGTFGCLNTPHHVRWCLAPLMLVGNYLILSSCRGVLCSYLLPNFVHWPFIMFLHLYLWLSVISTVWCLATWSTVGVGHILCKITESKTTWALSGLSFNTFLIFESASNTCAFMNNMDTVPIRHLFIADNWISYLMNTELSCWKKGKGAVFVDTPTATITATLEDTLTDSPAALYAPASPQPHTAQQTVCFNMRGGKTQTETEQPLPVKSPSKLSCFPEMAMLLHCLGRFLNCCFSQNLYSGCGYLVAERDRLCWWELQVKKHSLYLLLFLMVKTTWCNT